ncbi:hypothetical protein UlMin_020999 [Ulmus minor]
MAHQVNLISKSNPLRYLIKNPIPSSRITRWILVLSEFDIQVIPPTSKKSQAFAEFLAAFPTVVIDVDQPELLGELKEVSLVEEPEWQLMFDGAATTSGGGIGVVLMGPESQVITKTCKLLYSCSNNKEEYEALIVGLEIVESKNIKKILIKGDSRLVIQQLRGEFTVKEPALVKYRMRAQQILQKFQAYRLEHMVRSQNIYADALATLASKIDIRRNQQAVITVGTKGPTKTEPSHVKEDKWITDIKAKLAEGKMTDYKTIRHFHIEEGILYFKAPTGVLARFLSQEEASHEIKEIHEQISMNYAQRCQNCQLFGNKVHAPSVNLHPTNTPWPFHTWALDLIGPICPPSKGRIWILTATESFTKWTKAISLKKASLEAVAMFVMEYIICRFGVPRRVLTDNRTPFMGRKVKKLLEDYKIHHGTSTHYYP